MSAHKASGGFFYFSVPIYKCTVLVSWGDSLSTVVKMAKKNGCLMSQEWVDSTKKELENIQGYCDSLGEKNSDIFVWMKKRPAKRSEYGVLYHELYHAVEKIGQDHNLTEESEARAYLYEFLAMKCNDFFRTSAARRGKT